MQLDEPTTADVLARLRRIQGQVGGIIRMVEAGRGCREVVQQISAAGRALDQTGFKILASHTITPDPTNVNNRPQRWYFCLDQEAMQA